ncbi:MAG: glycerol-3-phosphate 1-O-acyltransferase PlsY [Defluviitaleaceae bacterium]|nr:glycerol-3-phosphate 1-O-acyltransferase PlsY [Defluviitaleaceae bacterium]
MDWFSFPYMAYAALLLLGGYLLGCIQTGYLVGRLVYKIDIRDHGSGGAGMTNAARVMGARAGVFVLLIDAIKCMAAFAIAAAIFDGSGTFFTSSIHPNFFPGMLAALGCVIGHCFPFFLGFRGGKGAACSIGLLIMFDWQILLILLGIGLLTVFITRYISAGSLLGFALLPPTLGILGFGMPVVIISICISAIGWYTHRANILRLLRGQENKFSIKRNK